jgi:hypothetical protein
MYKEGEMVNVKTPEMEFLLHAFHSPFIVDFTVEHQTKTQV